MNVNTNTIFFTFIAGGSSESYYGRLPGRTGSLSILTDWLFQKTGKAKALCLLECLECEERKKIDAYNCQTPP